MNDLTSYASRVNARLEQIPAQIPEGAYTIGEMPWLLSKSMRYSLCAGGKRLRPAMLLATVDLLEGDPDYALDFACAVEMIHTSSLIHDDLPGMDNDTMRRGRPTNHVVFGEGQAILAGDGLLNCAFETMLAAASRRPDRAADSLFAIGEIAHAAGVTGMIAGQVMDLYCEEEKIADDDALKYIHHGKTACMFVGAMRAGGRLCGADDDTLKALSEYAESFGLLFQATDDLLDVIGDQTKMGKTLGKDKQSGKLTCISAYGIDGTRAIIADLHDRARDSLARFGQSAGFFIELVDAMVSRTK